MRSHYYRIGSVKMYWFYTVASGLPEDGCRTKHMAGMSEKEVWVVPTEHEFVCIEVIILCVLQMQ